MAFVDKKLTCQRLQPFNFRTIAAEKLPKTATFYFEKIRKNAISHGPPENNAVNGKGQIKLTLPPPKKIDWRAAAAGENHPEGRRRKNAVGTGL